MDPHERHKQWCNDLDSLAAHIHELHLRIEVIEGIDAELVRNQRPGSGFVSGVLRRMYAESQVVRVRLLIDGGKGTRSLVRLVADLAEHATVLTRDRYIAPYESRGYGSLGESDFDAFAGEGAVHIPRARLIDLRSELEGGRRGRRGIREPAGRP